MGLAAGATIGTALDNGKDASPSFFVVTGIVSGLVGVLTHLTVLEVVATARAGPVQLALFAAKNIVGLGVVSAILSLYWHHVGVGVAGVGVQLRAYAGKGVMALVVLSNRVSAVERWAEESGERYDADWGRDIWLRCYESAKKIVVALAVVFVYLFLASPLVAAYRGYCILREFGNRLR